MFTTEAAAHQRPAVTREGGLLQPIFELLQGSPPKPLWQWDRASAPAVIYPSPDEPQSTDTLTELQDAASVNRLRSFSRQDSKEAATAFAQTSSDLFRESPAWPLYRWGKLLGFDLAPLPWQIFVRLVLVSSIAVFPMVGVWDKNSFMYEQRQSSFGTLWTFIGAGVGVALLICHHDVFNAMASRPSFHPEDSDTKKKTGVFKCNLKRGHMLLLLLEVDWNRPEANSLKSWMKWGKYVCMGFPVFYSMQGPAWVLTGWFGTIYKEDFYEGLLWTWFYFACAPSAAYVIGMTVWTTGCSNAATCAHLTKVEDLAPDEGASAPNVEAQLSIADDIMDLLVDINTRIMPTTMDGWNRPFLVLYSTGASWSPHADACIRSKRGAL